MVPSDQSTKTIRLDRHATRQPPAEPVTVRTPGALRLSRALAHTVSAADRDPLADRILAAFVGEVCHREAGLCWGVMRSALHWERLLPWLTEAGWHCHGALSFNQHRLAHTLDTGLIEQEPGRSLELPRGITVYLERGGVRATLEFESNRHAIARYERISVGLLASAPVAGFFREWDAFVRATHPLRGQTLQPDGRLVDLRGAPTWDDVVLPDGVADTIRFQVDFLLAHAAELSTRFGVRRRRGLILSGPPGTGKTLIGRILAAATPATMLWVTPGFLEDDDDVQEVCALARLVAPSILFLEDIDLVAEDRYSARDASALGELMNQLDGGVGDHPIVTIATTNRPAVLEEAIRSRPGRFDRVIEIPAPPAAGCRRLLERRLAVHGCRPADLAWLVTQALGRTGAELEELANTVLMIALERAHRGGGAVRVDRPILEAALSQLGVECKRLGFHAPGDPA